jgi:hypothetical protein
VFSTHSVVDTWGCLFATDETMNPDYIIGVDLGQAQDFTALAVLERRPFQANGEGRDEPVLWVRHLQRFPLGAPYPTIVAQVAAMKRALQGRVAKLETQVERLSRLLEQQRAGKRQAAPSLKARPPPSQLRVYPECNHAHKLLGC